MENDVNIEKQNPQWWDPAAHGPQLRKNRLARGLSQADVAQALSTSKVSVAAWEHGRRSPMPVFRDRMRELGLVRDEAGGDDR